MKETVMEISRRGLLGVLTCTPEMSFSIAYQKLIFRVLKILSIINKEKTLSSKEH